MAMDSQAKKEISRDDPAPDPDIVDLTLKRWREIYNKEFIALDYKITGLTPYVDHIIEVCAIKYENRVETDKYVTLVNPGGPIPSDTTRVNHITDNMVYGKPVISDVLGKLEDFIGNIPLAVYDPSIYIYFTIAEYKKNFTNQVLATQQASKKHLSLPYNKLKIVLRHLGIDTEKLPREETDTKAIAEIVFKLIDICETKYGT